MSEVYHLYLDESETHIKGKNRVFCVAGIIIKKSDYDNILVPEVNLLKRNIWHDVVSYSDNIFHEAEIRDAQNRLKKTDEIKPQYRRFRSNQYSRMLYGGLNSLFSKNIMTVVGACISEDELYNHFDKEKLATEKYLIAMQIILENFCHFLEINNGIGYVFVESRQAGDKTVRLHFNNIKAMGSLYITPFAMQTYLKEIEFPEKTSNNEGLQIADFVPNNFARKFLGKDKHRFNIYNAVRIARYDGNLGKHNRFGVKFMP